MGLGMIATASHTIFLVNRKQTGFTSRMAHDLMESATYLSSLLSKGFSRSLLSKASELGFSPGQFPVLIELWNEEGLTQRQLLDRLDIEQATLANTLSRMERDGLIVRTRHPTDKRATCNFLTDRGREIESRALAAAVEADEALFKGFRRFERELMLEYMRWAIENARKL
jgi:DNA-binding MarR family transcriptional regulator